MKTLTYKAFEGKNRKIGVYGRVHWIEEFGYLVDFLDDLVYP